MSEQEQPVSSLPMPEAGGSYTRQPDGSLVRNDDTPPAASPDAAPRTPRLKPAKEK